jgi:hypothetical protein
MYLIISALPSHLASGFDSTAGENAALPYYFTRRFSFFFFLLPEDEAMLLATTKGKCLG